MFVESMQDLTALGHPPPKEAGGLGRVGSVIHGLDLKSQPVKNKGEQLVPPCKNHRWTRLERGVNMNPIHFDLTLVVQVLSFLLLVYILRRFAWNPLMNMMEERRNQIEANIANAEKERLQAEQIKREYQEEMRKARQEAQEVIAKATKLSEQRAAEILASAQVEAEKIKKAALVDIERERDLAIAQVQAQVADLSVAVAEKIIRKNLDVKGQEDMIEQFIQEVGELPC